VKPESIAKAKATRARTMAWKKGLAAERAQFAHLKELDEKKVEKLERLASDPAATPAEAENARQRADALRRKARPQSKFSRPPPRGKSWEAMRDEVRARNSARAKEAHARRRKSEGKPPKPEEPQPKKPTQPAAVAEARRLAATPSDGGAEITRLKQEIARLKQEIAQLKQPRPPGRPGRKPIGERAMTAAERMRKMRLRNVTK
jgi:hypothetical protein